MTSYGSVISLLRKRADMTQAELGEKLNVSSQAVSKWENDLSQPDFDTIKKMCSLFEISVDDFSAMVDGKPLPTKQEQVASPTPTPEPMPVVDPDPMIGICKDCGNSIYKRNKATKPTCSFKYEKQERTSSHRGGTSHYTTTVPTYTHGSDLVCESCNNIRLADKKVFEERQARNAKLSDPDVSRNKCIFTLILGIILGVALCVFGLVEKKELWYVSVLSGYGLFAFVSLLGHSCVTTAIMEGGLSHSTSLPGIIFSLDIDGIVFMLVYKFIIAPLACFFIWLLFVIGAFFLAMFVAMFVWPFKVHTIINDIKYGY